MQFEVWSKSRVKTVATLFVSQEMSMRHLQMSLRLR